MKKITQTSLMTMIAAIMIAAITFDPNLFANTGTPQGPTNPEVPPITDPDCPNGCVIGEPKGCVCHGFHRYYKEFDWGG